MLSRVRRRRLTMGLETVLGLRKRGFFLPYRYAASVQAPPSYPALEPLFEDAVPAFTALLDEMDGLKPSIDQLADGAHGCRLDQAWFPRMDALAAYSLLRRRRPARIVEIGSGHSSRFMAAAIKDGDLPTTLTCIDPEPRASLATLEVTWRKTVLKSAPVADFQSLARGDVLFVDSSHLLMPGTDVDHLIGHLLPSMPVGILLLSLIHI